MAGMMGGFGGNMNIMGMIRSGVDTTKGIGDKIQGKMFEKKARDAAPPLQDAGQVATLEMLKQKARGFGTGSAFTAERGMVEQQAAATRGAISRNTGGDINSMTNAFLKTQQGANTGIGQVIANESQREQFFTNAFVTQQNLVAQRTLELQLLQQSKFEAKAATFTQSGESSLVSGLKMS